MGRKTLEITAEEQEKYSGCKLCGITFSKFNTKVLTGGKPTPYPLAKLKGQYEHHLTTAKHQQMAKGVEAVAPEHNSSLELQVKKLVDEIDYLKNQYTTLSQLTVRCQNEMLLLRQSNAQLDWNYKLLRRDLSPETHKTLECLGEYTPDDMYKYISFETRLRDLEKVNRPPIPEGERVIPTPITMNNHRVVQLIDDNYVPEVVKPKTMILTEEETPKPVAMIPETLQLDVLKGIKKVQVVEERNEIRHIIPTRCEESDKESDKESDEEKDDDYYRKQVEFNMKNPQWSDENDSSNNSDEWCDKQYREEEERLTHFNSEQCEMYGRVWELINKRWEELITDKNDDNREYLIEIQEELENIMIWISNKISPKRGEYVEKQSPFKTKEEKKEALRVYNHLGSVNNLLLEIIEKYYTVEYTKVVLEVGQELEIISDQVFTVDEIIDGEMFIYQ